MRLARIAFLSLALCCFGSWERASGAGSTVGAPTCCPVVELRQYTLYPQKRDGFIDLFERHFIESQEALGIDMIAEFRVLDDPNRFFWLRGFTSMQARPAALHAFYYGPVWKAYRTQANPALVDNDNVLLLHQAHPGSGFPQPVSPRPGIGAAGISPGLAVATIYTLGDGTPQAFDEKFEKSIRPVVESAGARIVATFLSEHSPNNFPALPVRSNANVFVWLACFSDQHAYQRYADALAVDSRWAQIRENFALSHMFVQPEVWRLEPTPRSQVRC